MVQDGKTNCFAYREVRGRLVCSALRTNTCTNCKFYKPANEVDKLQIEQDIRKYVRGI